APRRARRAPPRRRPARPGPGQSRASGGGDCVPHRRGGHPFRPPRDPRKGPPVTQRTAHAQRTTSESDVSVSIDLDGTGTSTIDTGVPFYDHMLTALSKHSLIDMEIRATGDVHIAVHHTVEDTAITLGRALGQALGDKAGIRRYGDATVPLDEALAQAVVDVSGRPYFVHEGESEAQRYHLIGGHFTGSMTGHALE